MKAPEAPPPPHRTLPSRSPPLRARQDGRTGLVQAAQEGHVEVARLLVEHKAAPPQDHHQVIW